MNKLLKYRKIIIPATIGLVSIIVIFFGYKLVKLQITKHNFFNQYDVITLTGKESFNNSVIKINGQVIEKTADEWTNVLPIKNSLDYIKLQSSYGLSKSIQCGDIKIEKRVENINLGENEWCIEHGDNKYAAISSATYFPYGGDYVVYEQCLRPGYYQSLDKSNSVNGCAERGLFINDKKIATSVEINEVKIGIPGASSFNYYPSKRLGDTIVYSTDKATFSYDINTEKTTQYSNDINPKIKDIFLTNDGKLVYVYTEKELADNGMELGQIGKDPNSFGRIYSADYIDGHLYIIKYSGQREETNSSIKEDVYSYELIKDGKKVANFQVSSTFIFGYDTKGVDAFPYCDYTTLVCIYEDGHYAYKNRVQVDYYSYGFYVNEMVIDNETHGDHIPDMIGRSKPIFKNGKLDSIIYINSFGKGLYVANMKKNWKYKSFMNHNGPVTKILGGYQNALLNVVAK